MKLSTLMLLFSSASAVTIQSGDQPNELKNLLEEQIKDVLQKMNYSGKEPLSFDKILKIQEDKMNSEKQEMTKTYKSKMKDIDLKYPLAHISEEAIKEVTDNWPKAAVSVQS